jgi:hypothetical protein
MKIISRGVPQKEKEAEWSCDDCRSRISSKQEEGKTTYDQRDGNFVTFICPVCSFKNHVNLSKFK